MSARLVRISVLLANRFNYAAKQFCGHGHLNERTASGQKLPSAEL